MNIKEPKIKVFQDGGTSTAVVDLLAADRKSKGFKKNVLDCFEAVELNRLPEKKGQVKNYILSLHEKSPLETINVLGLTFSKYMTQPKKSENMEPKQIFCIVPLSKNQMDAVEEKAKKSEIKWRESDGSTCVSNHGEFIILKEFSDGNWKQLTAVDEIATNALDQVVDKVVDENIDEFIVNRCEYEKFIKFKQEKQLKDAESAEKRAKRKKERK